MFLAVPLSIIMSSITVRLALVYVIRFEDSFPAGLGWLGPARKLSTNRMTYTSAKRTVIELLMMGRGTARNM